jgi:hypothetical protein
VNLRPVTLQADDERPAHAQAHAVVVERELDAYVEANAAIAAPTMLADADMPRP